MKLPTFQELLADFSDQTFIGRHTYLALFHHMFVAPRPPFLILNIHGQPGMGKTALLHELGAIAHGYDVLTAISNADQTSVSQVLQHLFQQFAEQQEQFVSNVLLSGKSPEDSTHFPLFLDQLASQQKLVLCFDDYDDTAVFLDEWLRQLLLGDFGTFSSQILFVIASRRPLTKPWLTFQRALHQMELEVFSDNEARAFLRQCHIHDPQTMEQLLKQSQKVPRALAELVAQYDDLGDSASLWQRGRGHFEAKAFINALTDFERAIYLQPENDYLYHWRGRTHWETDNQSAALADFSKAIELQPRRVTYYHWRGLAHRKAHDYLAALADFSEAIQLQPHNGNNYWARGYTYREAQDYQAAVSDFTKAIELQPENINFYYWRGRSYLEMNDTARAWADFVHIKNILRQKQNPPHYSNGSS